MPIDKTCLHCGTKFRVKPKDAARKFCAQPCRRAHEAVEGRAVRAVPIQFECKTCSGPFEMKPAYLTAYRKKHGKDPRYCSMKCMGLAKRLTDAQWSTDCVQCGKRMPIQRRPGGTVNRLRTLCSTECRSLFRRLSYQQHNPTQQPTRRVARHGYIRLIVPGTLGEPSRDMLEHRYVMEQNLGRPLFKEETVHHINGVRVDNSLENLELFSSRHGPGQRVIDKVDFAIEILRLYPEFARQRGVELHQLPTSSVATAPEVHLSLPS